MFPHRRIGDAHPPQCE